MLKKKEKLKSPKSIKKNVEHELNVPKGVERTFKISKDAEHAFNISKEKKPEKKPMKELSKKKRMKKTKTSLFLTENKQMVRGIKNKGLKHTTKPAPQKPALKKKTEKKPKTQSREFPVASKSKKLTQLPGYSKQIHKTETNQIHKAKIRVIGIGGGGGSIVSEISSKIKKIDFVAANTDLQALKNIPKQCKRFEFGQKLTSGLGCGMDSKLGEKAANAARDKTGKLFQNVDLCILVATLGGGTGSGASPEFAKIASDLGVLTFGVFTLPFKFEGQKRLQIAKNSLEKLIPNLNALTIIPNEKIFQFIDKKTPLKAALSIINKKLSESLEGFIETIYMPGLINIDFADIKTILESKGKIACLSSAQATGSSRMGELCREVLRSPLNEYDIKGADRIMFNIASDQNLGMLEVGDISRTIFNSNPKAKIIFGVSQDKTYNNKIRITLLAVGCGKKEERKKIKPTVPTQQKSRVRFEPENKSESEKKSQLKLESGSESKPEEETKIEPKLELKSESKEPESEPKPKPELTKPQPKLKSKPKPKSKPSSKPSPKPESKESKPESKSKSESKSEPKPESKPESKSEPKPLEPKTKPNSKKVKLSLRKEENKPKGKLLKKEDEQKAESSSPNSQSNVAESNPSRRNALQLKEKEEEIEKEIEAKEKKWDTPTFLRRKMKLDT